MRKFVTIIAIVNAGLRFLGLHARIVKHRLRILVRRMHHRGRFQAVSRDVARDHRAMWSALYRPVDASWLRLYSTVSSCPDSRYVPEDIYYAIIERRLNDANYSEYVSEKNYYERYLDPGLFPRVFLRKMSGVFLDGDYAYLSPDEARSRFESLSEPAIIKPASGSGGGRDVRLLRPDGGVLRSQWKSPVEFAEIDRKYRDNDLVQKVIDQHATLAAFNSTSVNTLRLFTYRSVPDDVVHVLRCVFRTGRHGMVVDNQAAGGLSCHVDLATGRLHAYAVNKFGERHAIHPDSGKRFGGTEIPSIQKAVDCVRSVAARIVSQRLLSFDVAITATGGIQLVEINTMGMELNFLQFAGGPLFGDFTAEVIEYCRAHHQRDNLRIVRT